MTRFATPSQRRFVLAAKLRPHDPSMNWALLCALPDGVEPQRMADAARGVMAENDSSNEVFDTDEHGAVVATLVDVEHSCPVVHYADAAALHAAAQRLADAPFDLSTAPLYHAEIAVAEGVAYFVFIGAHVIADGRGFYNMTQDFAGRYADDSYAAPSRSSPVDTAEDLSIKRSDAVAYFAETFAGVASLQIDEWDRRDSKGRIRGGISRTEISFHEYDSAKKLADALGVRRYSVLLTVYGLALSCLTGETDLAVSNPMANRRADANAAATRGVRVNSLPARIDLTGHDSFASLCRNIDRQVAKLVEFEQYAFSDFARHVFATESVDATQPSASFTVHPLALAPVIDGRRAEPVNLDRDYIQYPMSVALEVGADAVSVIVERADHIPDVDVAALLRRVLAQAVETEGQATLDEIDWVTPATAGRISAHTRWPATTLVEQFAETVREHSGAIAVVDSAEAITYAELDDRSSRIAVAVASGITDALVGVALEPSVELVATVLGILKAGKAYLPIDRTAPAARVEQIAAACGGLTVLSRNADWVGIAGIDLVDPDLLAADDAADELSSPTPDTVAYVIFTSGTTGEPKGVQISHASATRFFDSFRADVALDALRWPLLHSIAFDISIVESFNALLSGAALYIPRAGIKQDPHLLRDFLSDNDIDVISQTPSAFTMLAPLLLDGQCPKLKAVLFCGERLELQALGPFVGARPDVALINCYGITETTMHHTHYRLPAESRLIPDESVIGIPLSDTDMWVVDRHRRTVPRGVPGELVMAGPGVMDGYLGGVAATAAKVIELGGARAYLSGDRGYLGADGQFVVLGRFDSQVKIRGHRCELGEIEHALRRTGEAEKVHAMIFGSGLEAELVCFVVLRPEGSVDRLRTSLRDWLPRYLEPDHCIVMDRIPLNNNGKTDSVALTEAYRTRAEDAPAKPKPAQDTSIGQTVDEIWRDVLGSDDFDGSTRFFEAGGSSALLLRVGGEIRSRLDITDFDVVDLFEYCTPDSLSEFLEDIG